MRIIRAEHLGMCFGVRDAIALAISQNDQQPVTVLGDLVHNENVLRDLKQRGIRIVQDVTQAPTELVMITAHGASEKAIMNAVSRGLNVVEATCPLVRLAHRAVAKLVREGYHPVIVGKRDHVEVRGMTEDLKDFDVVLTETDVENLQDHPRFGILAQTTQPIETVRHLVGAVRKRFPNADVRFVDTVCQPTKQRQNAAIEMAERSDVVVVIGGAHSNNTHELVKTCGKHCRRVHHVQTADDLKPEWFFDAETVGVTAGTSTPDKIIDEVEAWLCQLAANRNALAAHSHHSTEHLN